MAGGRVDPVRLEIKRRREDKENIASLHEVVMDRLRSIALLWADQDKQPGPLVQNEMSSVADLTPALAFGFSGSVRYISRTALENADDASFDDSLTIGINLDQITDTRDFDYRIFARSLAPRVIEAFGAYRAKMNTDEARAVSDWDMVRHEMIEHNRSIEGRDGVIRIWPVSYFDDTLCQRAWGLSAEEVVRRAAPGCEEAYPLAGGAFLLVTSELVRGDALDDLSDRVMSRLRQ